MPPKTYYADGSPRHIAVYGEIKSNLADYITVVFTKKSDKGRQTYLSMSDFPFNPQGFCEHGETHTGKRGVFGKRFTFYDLNADCQRAVMRDYVSMWGGCVKGENTLHVGIIAKRFIVHRGNTHTDTTVVFPNDSYYALFSLAGKHLSRKFYKSREDAVNAVRKSKLPVPLSEFTLYSGSSNVVETFYAADLFGTYTAEVVDAKA